MYYGGMSKQEILGSSRPFLMAIYGKYVSRAYENLGTSADKIDEETGEVKTLGSGDYPLQLAELTQKARETPPTPLDREFMAGFGSFNGNDYEGL